MRAKYGIADGDFHNFDETASAMGMKRAETLCARNEEVDQELPSPGLRPFVALQRMAIGCHLSFAFQADSTSPPHSLAAKG